MEGVHIDRPLDVHDFGETSEVHPHLVMEGVGGVCRTLEGGGSSRITGSMLPRNPSPQTGGAGPSVTSLSRGRLAQLALMDRPFIRPDFGANWRHRGTLSISMRDRPGWSRGSSSSPDSTPLGVVVRPAIGTFYLPVSTPTATRRFRPTTRHVAAGSRRLGGSTPW